MVNGSPRPLVVTKHNVTYSRQSKAVLQGRQRQDRLEVLSHMHFCHQSSVFDGKLRALRGGAWHFWGVSLVVHCRTLLHRGMAGSRFAGVGLCEFLVALGGSLVALGLPLNLWPRPAPSKPLQNRPLFGVCLWAYARVSPSQSKVSARTHTGAGCRLAKLAVAGCPFTYTPHGSSLSYCCCQLCCMPCTLLPIVFVVINGLRASPQPANCSLKFSTHLSQCS